MFTHLLTQPLESTPLANEDLFQEICDAIVEAYYRDYPDHASQFRPTFLINDIIRFWKTLCLNYEHRRNRPEGDKLLRRKQQVKNFKLKFSRLMTCFGTLVAICARPSPIDKAEILRMTRMTPLQRFLNATELQTDLAEIRRAVIEDYEWFMQNTALTTEELQDLFESKEGKVEMFRRGEVFGERVYDVLNYFAERNKYRRYLVV